MADGVHQHQQHHQHHAVGVEPSKPPLDHLPNIDDEGLTLSQKLKIYWRDRTFYTMITIGPFVLGLSDISSLAVSYTFKDDYLYSPAELAVVSGLIVFPWMIKPLWGFLSDTFPLASERRRPYFLLAALLASAGYILIALVVVHEAAAFILCLIMSALGLCVISVLAEALIVEKVQADTRFDEIIGVAAAGDDAAAVQAATERAQAKGKRLSATLMSIYWISNSVAKIIAGGLGGVLLEVIPKRSIFMITGLIVVVIFFVALFLHEKRCATLLSPAVQLQLLAKALQLKVIWGPLLFVFVFSMMPSSSTTFFYYLTNGLHMTPSFLGMIAMVSGLFSIFGLLFYQSFLINTPYRALLAWMIVIRFGFSLLPLLLVFRVNEQIGISNEWFMIGDSALASALSQIATLPLLAIGARHCPPNIEATLYSFLVSAFNFGGMLSDDLGGAVTYVVGVTAHDFNKLWIVILICSVSQLVPFALLQFIDEQQLMTHPPPHAHHHKHLSTDDDKLAPTTTFVSTSSSSSSVSSPSPRSSASVVAEAVVGTESTVKRMSGDKDDHDDAAQLRCVVEDDQHHHHEDQDEYESRRRRRPYEGTGVDEQLSDGEIRQPAVPSPSLTTSSLSSSASSSLSSSASASASAATDDDTNSESETLLSGSRNRSS